MNDMPSRHGKRILVGEHDRGSLPWLWIIVIIVGGLIAILTAKLLEPVTTMRRNAFVIDGRPYNRDEIACFIDKSNLVDLEILKPCSTPWVSYDPYKEDRVLHVLMLTGICQSCTIEYQYPGPVGTDPRRSKAGMGLVKVTEPLDGTGSTFRCYKVAPECIAYIDVEGIFWTLQIDRSEPDPMTLYRKAESELRRMAR